MAKRGKAESRAPGLRQTLPVGLAGKGLAWLRAHPHFTVKLLIRSTSFSSEDSRFFVASRSALGVNHTLYLTVFFVVASGPDLTIFRGRGESGTCP